MAYIPKDCFGHIILWKVFLRDVNRKLDDESMSALLCASCFLLGICCLFGWEEEES